MSVASPAPPAGGAGEHTRFAGLLRSALELVEPLRTVLPSWHARIREFLGECSSSRLRIGVIGITSSGKSAFINQLGGESLLPEESQATTNVPVICRHGPERKVRVMYEKDFRVETFVGAKVTPALVKSFCAESDNPNNRNGVRRVEVEMPTYLVNPSLELIDTPGTDAFGHEHHTAITIQQCIPIADIVVFMVRGNKGGLHEADAALLAHVLEGDQRIMFVIACSDLILESTERGRVATSREQKVENTVKAFRTSLESFPTLASAPVIPISSMWARLADGDQSSDLWRDSNFDAVLMAFDACASDLDAFILEERKIRARAYVRSLARQIPDQAGELDKRAQTTDEERKELARMEAEARQFHAAKAAIAQEVSTFESAALKSLDSQALLAGPLASISYTEKSLHDARAQADERLRTSTGEINSALTALRTSVRERSKRVGIEPSRRNFKEEQLKVEALPSAHDFITSESVTYHVDKPRGWGLIGEIGDALFGVRTEARTRIETSVDRHAFREALTAYFESACQTWRDFVSKQAAMLQSVYAGPIEGELKKRRQSIADFKAIRELAAEQRACLPGIVKQLEALLAADEPRRSVREVWSDVAGTSPSMPASRPGPARESNLAMRSLLGIVWDCAAARCFWRTVARNIGPRRVESILLVGQKRSKLEEFARLLRSGAPSSGGVDAVWSGERPVDISALDDRLSLDEFGSRCARASVIVVEFDAAQPSSGLSALRRDPRRAELTARAGKVILASWEGAAFDHRLADLPEEVAPMLGRDSGFGARPWYVIELDRRDARYTDLIEIHDEVSRSDGGNRGLMARWSENRLSTNSPFTLEALKSIAATDMHRRAHA